MTDKELQDFIKHGETGFVEFAMVFGDGWARHAIEIAKELRTRLSQCERCGEVNPAEIHTCSPQEPVAWFCELPDNKISIKIVGKPTEGNWKPLYTTPPQREWQDLTDDESDEIWGECLGVFDCLRMTQAKLKEKNG